jgi:hypothetical protein
MMLLAAGIGVAMSVNGVCQSCGAIAPIEWFLADAEHRNFAALVAELPREIAPLIYHYLSLFKVDNSRAMQIRKAVRLVTELKTMVGSGYVQIDRKVARTCPPRLWAQAIEQMIERRNRLTLPMPNHNYLKSIAWQIADQEDAKVEKQNHTARPIRSGGSGPISSIQNPMDAYIQGLRDTKPTDEEMDEWRKERMQG